LNLIAPVTAVYGNTDDRFAMKLPGSIDIVIDGLRIHVSHGHELGRPTPAQLAEAYDADVIVYGHTHIQMIERVGAKLVINPGAAGPRRFNLLPSVARLTIANGIANAELISLAV
jgi:putative phosphoesterase